MAQYQDISEQIEKLVGGRDNISHVTHCATRLRLVLKDNKKADMEGLENLMYVHHTILIIKFLKNKC